MNTNTKYAVMQNGHVLRVFNSRADAENHVIKWAFCLAGSLSIESIKEG